MSDTNTTCGFAAIIGLPNAGKSTLMNTLIGAKVSIVSHKVQTTRARALGITVEDQTQIVFIDTPGIFEPKKPLEKAMVEAALESLSGADVILHLVDASNPKAAENNAAIIQKLPEHNKTYLLLNKTDKVQKESLLALTAALNEQHSYNHTFMISGKRGDGLKELMAAIKDDMPQGPWLFPEDQITDLPMRMLAAEITREKIFERLHQELPYSIFVHTENWEEFDNGDVKIEQVVTVERDSQKGIVLGKGGAQIKAIGEQSRKDLEKMLERRVHIKIFVKVQTGWQNRSENYRLIGL